MKKGIAAVLAAAIVCSAVPGFAWEQVESNSLTQAKQLLDKLEIMDSADGSQENVTITRG